MSDQERILKILQRVTGKDVQPDADESLFDSGVLDSFALADLVSGLEEEFHIKVPDSDLNPRKFESLSRIENYLADHR